MSEQVILDLVRKDPWMMEVLMLAEGLHLPDWAIGAGFLRNKVWDHLHGYSKVEVNTPDIDLVYFDPNGNDQQADEQLTVTFKDKTGLAWEIVNEAYAHAWSSIPPYSSTADAISQWPETATAVGVKIEKGNLILIAPHGIDDLVNLILRPSPRSPGGMMQVKERARKKQWLEKWPKLTFASDSGAQDACDLKV